MQTVSNSYNIDYTSSLRTLPVESSKNYYLVLKPS
uniref:Uncharacterized protein n=1 Tax=Arundo donax TaxID=35708 RepID=A0A0A9G806_ARUDO